MPTAAAVLLAGVVLNTQTAEAASSVPGVAPGCTWQVHQLPTPTGWSYPFTSAVKGEGTWWAGYGSDGAGASSGLVWHDGQATALTAPGPGPSRAWDVNSSGTVVATYSPAQADGSTGPGVPYLWRNGVITRLAVPAGAYVTPSAINDAGQIVGLSAASGVTQAITWSATSPGRYTLLGTGGEVNAFVSDLSNRGAFVGTSRDGGFGKNRKAIGGRLSPAVPIQALPGLSTTVNSGATATEGTYVVGTGQPSGSTSTTAVGLYVNAAVSTTPQPLIGRGTPTSVNASGLIAGNGSSTFAPVATVWTPSQRWSLPDLYPAASSLAGSSAEDVMDDGTVIGSSQSTQNDKTPVSWTCR